MAEALDPLPLLHALAERAIGYIVIGGFAVSAHGFIRVTKDLDIVPAPAYDNLERLAQLLRALDATLLDSDDSAPVELSLDPRRPEDLAQGGNFCVSTSLGRLEIMQWVAGIAGEDLFAELERGAIEGEVDGVAVRVCSLAHLRAMKRAAGRPQDLEDLRHLGEAP